MWISEGLPLDQFWRITPLEFTNVMRGRAWAQEQMQRLAISAAWHVEAFRRTKRLPDLERLLSPSDEIAEQTPDDILGVLQAIEAAGSNNMTIKKVEAPAWLLQ